jgi:3',5'-nucleoside bisphosphate phosphatase
MPLTDIGGDRHGPGRRSHGGVTARPETQAVADTLHPVIDLHTHSTVSDGSDPPHRIAELAAAAGCTTIALTDHDRLDGVVAASARAADLGLGFVSGCELSCEVGAGTMHVLVYWLAPGAGPLQDELVRLQHARDTRNQRMAALLANLGLPVSYDELQAEAGGMGAGRPHVAAILLRKGVVGSVQEAFDVWLAKGKPAYVEKERLLPGDALQLAKASGSVAVLAHPLSLDLTPEALDRTVGELAERGLSGLEAIYGRYTPEQRGGLLDVAARHGLVATGGSDHHGTYKPDLQVGIGRGDLDVPESVIEDLAARLPA